MGDSISAPITEEVISAPITEEDISVVILGGDTWQGVQGVRAVAFANPLELDGTSNKDFKCSDVTGDTTVNLTNVGDGEAGMIELINSIVATITLGTMFTKNVGGGVIYTAASGDNVIAWTKSGADILYCISQIE